MDNVSNVFRQAAKPDVVVFISQVLMLFIVVITCLINLTLYPNSESKSLWVTFLTGSLGYLMPNPRFKSYQTKEASAADVNVIPNGES